MCDIRDEMVADRGYLPVYEPGASLLTSTGLQELTAAVINGKARMTMTVISQMTEEELRRRAKKKT
jgi:hypothetical protein